MGLIYFITHPEVIVDKDIPVPDWELSEIGLERTKTMLNQPWIPSITKIYSSDENKAKIAARILSENSGLEVHIVEELGEMDRSSTGFIPPEEFEPIVDEFFANPTVSVKGWEVAVDVQKRIVSAITSIIQDSEATDNVAIISHGGVGGLLLTHLKDSEISRSFDQPNQGNYFIFDSETYEVMHGWESIDNIPENNGN